LRKISVVVAAYDEERNAEPLIRRLHAALSGIEGSRWQMIFVVEGRDETREILERVGAELGGDVRVLFEEKPRGIGKAFRRGFAAVEADADLVVTLDADLNHQPEEIPRLVTALETHDVDILIGSRFVHGSAVEGTPLWRRVLPRVMNLAMRHLYGLRARDKTSGFRVYRAAALRRLDYESDDFPFLPELLIRANDAGYRIAEEPIRFVYRKEGRSKMAFWKTSFSYLALPRTLRRARLGAAGSRRRA
jgi:dolichol-phosphate mannosyltransferase